MMNKPALALIGMLTFLLSCNENVKETPNGMKYTVIEAGDGETPQINQFLVFDYELRDSKDSVWGETFSEGIPAAAKIADSTNIDNEDGMSQMFRTLSVGDSVRVAMPITDFFNELVRAPAPPNIDTTLSVSYTVKVRDVMDEPEFLKAREEQFKQREARILNKDTEEIDQYLSDNDVTALQDTSGLQYIVHNESGKTKPTVDDCVEVKYIGRFLKTGEVFDEADRVSFPLNQVIPGWKLGIPKLGVGDSGTFYVPSKLAYGPQGYPGAIPPDAILVFNVTLLDVKDAFDPATRTCK
jgi:FKBP-type peptidyl-prolyl cis-trans isomerase FkpA